jgi:site-specific recombinase XerC
MILEITPLRLQNVNNSKKLSVIHSFLKYMHEQQEVNIKLIGNSVIKIQKTLPKPIDEKFIIKILNSFFHTKYLLISLLYSLTTRHYFVTYLFQQSVAILNVSKLLGHGMKKDIYTHKFQ